MTSNKKPIRKSVSVPWEVARRVQALAKSQRSSENRVLVSLIEAGLSAKDAERQYFHDLVEQLAKARGKAEQRRLKEELARLTFGD